MTNDKQKDRLVELIGEELLNYSSWSTEMALAGNYDMPSAEEVIADKLLADGWMRPPCKVGEHVWYFDIESRELVEGKVDGYLWFRSCGFALNVIWEKPIMGHFSYCRKEMPFSEVGKTVFLSREEAEAKLKEGVQG